MGGAGYETLRARCPMCKGDVRVTFEREATRDYPGDAGDVECHGKPNCRWSKTREEFRKMLAEAQEQAEDRYEAAAEARGDARREEGRKRT